MVSIKGEKREKEKRAELKAQENIPAVLYGPKIKNNILLKVNQKDFVKVYEEAGENTLLDLDIDGKKYKVLIYYVQSDHINLDPLHVDFYQPNLKEKVEAEVPLVFEGKAPAEKLGGTLITVDGVVVKALPQDLPKEIKINLEVLKTFEDMISVKDIVLGEGVKIKEKEDKVLAKVVPPEKEETEREEKEGEQEGKEGEEGKKEDKKQEA